MLVVSRYPEPVKGELVIVVPPGDTPQEIRVQVVEVCGAKVRLGLTADPAVRIDRREVYDRRQRLAANAGRPA